MKYAQITFDEIFLFQRMINQLIERIAKVVIKYANPNRDSKPLEDIRTKGSE